MYNADTQCTVGGERSPKGREEFLCLNFSCLAIKYEFYFTVPSIYLVYITHFLSSQLPCEVGTFIFNLQIRVLNL